MQDKTFPNAPIHRPHQRFDKDSYTKLKLPLPSPSVTTWVKGVTVTAGSTPLTPSRKQKENTIPPNLLATPPLTIERTLRFPIPGQTSISASLRTRAIQPKLEQPRRPPVEVRRVQNQGNIWDTSTADPFNDEPAVQTPKNISRPISTTCPTLANGHNLKPYQALDLQRLIAREHGEKVCGTDVSNDVGYLLAYHMG